MKRLFFLPPGISYGIFFLVVFSFWFLSFGQALLIGIVAGTVCYVFRRSAIPYRDTLKNDGEIFLAPMHGRVESIRQNVPILNNSSIGHEIRISVSLWDEKGLYLPTAAEVAYLKATKGKKISREAEGHLFYGPLEDVSHTDLTLSSKSGIKTLLRFVDCPHGQRPAIWLKSGDRGRGAACFGHWLLGGTLLIYLPQNSDILIFESEHMVPGQTVIAAIKKNEE